MCSLPLVGDEQHFVCYCPALQSVRDSYSDLFRVPVRALCQFMWQEDTIHVVNFIVDCFAKREMLRQGPASD
jgi:hypothetical protein